MAPHGITHRIVLNMLEAFFRRPFLHLVPLLVLLALGAVVAAQTPKEYRSVGVLNVTSGQLLTDLTDVPGGPSFGFETPAVVTARTFNNLVQTRTFLSTIIDTAGLRSAVQQGLLTGDEIKSSISVTGHPDNLIEVAVTSPRPEQSQRIAAAALATFQEFVVSTDIGDFTLRLSVAQTQLVTAQARYDEARQLYRDYLEAHPGPLTDIERPPEEVDEIGRLEDAVARASAAVQEAETTVANEQVGVNAARDAVLRQLRVIDSPELPETPQPRVQKAVLTVVLFAFLGAIISIGAVLVSALLDRTVRTPDDIAAKFGLDVLAVVPSARR